MLFRRANKDDKVARMIYQAAPDLLSYIFNFEDSSIEEFIEYDFKRGNGIFGYKNLFVSEYESEVIACLTAYCGSKYAFLTLATTISSLRFFGFKKFITIIKRSMTTARLFKSPSRKAIYIANGFVDPKYRLPGVFSSLVSCGEQLANENNLKTIECDVSYKNDRSLKVHQSFGFEITDESPYSGPETLLDGVRRLRLQID